MDDAPDYPIASDPGDRHQSGEHDQRGAAPDGGIRQRTIHSALDVHHVSVPTTAGPVELNALEVAGAAVLSRGHPLALPRPEPISGDYRGIAEVLGVFGEIFELSGGTFESELHDIFANDEHIVMLVTDRAVREGRTLDDNVAQVLHVRDGKVTEAWIHHTDLYATDAFWS